MRLRVISALAVIAATSAISATSARSTGSPSASVADDPDTATLYRVHCQMCHGPNGKAPLASMAFVGREKWKHGTSSAEMITTITEGVKGTPMMPFKSKLTPDQIRALALHVRAFDKRLPPEKQVRTPR